MIFSERNGSSQQAHEFQDTPANGERDPQSCAADRGSARSRPSGLVEEARTMTDMGSEAKAASVDSLRREL